MVARTERPISRKLMKFHRKEEMGKLKAIVKHILKSGKANKYELNY